MSKIIKLGMVFDENSVPDLGDIGFQPDRNLILTSGSVTKLKNNLTRSVCGAAFNLPDGIQAYVADIGDVLVYHPDAWYYVRRSAKTEKRYGKLQLCLKKNGENYILGEDEKIVFSIVSSDQTLLSKELYLIHFCGNGIYSYRLNMEDAHTLHDLSSYTISISVYSGDTDITSGFTVEYPNAEEWYDVHVVYDTGV